MKLFVFPIGQGLLYPQFSKPFHISDSRYIKMVNDSLSSGTPIAIGNVLEGSTNYTFHYGQPLNFVNDVVGYGMPIVVDKQPNGSIVIFLEGRGKARLGNVMQSGTEYIVCDAEKIVENSVVDPERAKVLVMAHKVMVLWMNQHIIDEHARNQFLNYIKTPEQIVGCYASYLISDHDLQQFLLESNDINEKIDYVGRIIASGELVA